MAQSRPIAPEDEETTMVHASEMQGGIPKTSTYFTFRVEQGIYFPPIDKITTFYMGDVMSGEKKVSLTDFSYFCLGLTQ